MRTLSVKKPRIGTSSAKLLLLGVHCSQTILMSSSYLEGEIELYLIHGPTRIATSQHAHTCLMLHLLITK